MKKHGRTATKLIGEEIARLTEMARRIKEKEKDNPCDDEVGGAVVPVTPLLYGTEERQSEFWRSTSTIWYEKWARIRKERNDGWRLWFDRYNELKKFKLANYSLKEIHEELVRRGRG